MKKFHTCRALEANQGDLSAYRKKLLKLQRDYRRFIVRQIGLHLLDTGELTEKQYAADRSLSNPRPNNPFAVSDKLKLMRLQPAVLSALAKENPERVKANIDAFVAKHLTEWQKLYGENVKRLAVWLVKSTYAHTTYAQRRIFTAAGIKREFFERKFTIPIGKQYVSPAAAATMEDQIRENVDLITKIGAADVSRISETVSETLTSGSGFSAIEDELRKTDGFDEARVKRVALDQVNKLNSAVQAANAKELGITQAVWKHVPGQYTSRETHIKMDGKKFDLSEGIYDPDVGYNVLPAQLPFCRCVARFVLDLENLKD